MSNSIGRLTTAEQDLIREYRRIPRMFRPAVLAALRSAGEQTRLSLWKLEQQGAPVLAPESEITDGSVDRSS